MSSIKYAHVSKDCVACGTCLKVCPMNAISINKGITAVVDEEICIGCGKCAKACPAAVISIEGRERRTQKPKAKSQMRTKRWYDYLWIFSLVYLFLGFFNILFAYIGLLCFTVPLMIAIIRGDKSYCNKYCGRGQLFTILGDKLGISLKKDPPKFLRSSIFRYGFLVFFLSMFFMMIYSTYLVFAGAPLKQAVTLLWLFKLPWNWSDVSFVPAVVAQFAFGFYSVMLTSTVLGLVTMIIFKPRTWCVYCPMGTMTQGICKIKNKGESVSGEKSKTNCRAFEGACQR